MLLANFYCEHDDQLRRTLGVPVKLEDVTGHPHNSYTNNVCNESHGSLEEFQAMEIASLPI